MNKVAKRLISRVQIAQKYLYISDYLVQVMFLYECIKWSVHRIQHIDNLHGRYGCTYAGEPNHVTEEYSADVKELQQWDLELAFLLDIIIDSDSWSKGQLQEPQSTTWNKWTWF